MNLTEYTKTQIEPSVYTRHQETAMFFIKFLDFSVWIDCKSLFFCFSVVA